MDFQGEELKEILNILGEDKGKEFAEVFDIFDIRQINRIRLNFITKF